VSEDQSFDIQPFLKALRVEAQSLIHACEKHESEPDLQKQVTRALQILRASLDQGGKIIVTGLGKSGKIAQKIAATFTSTGSLAIYLHPTEGLHGDVGVLQSQDCVLALSHTGNTDELLQLIPTIRRRGVRIIGIVGNRASRLASLCDATLDSSVEQEACPLNLAPTASTTTALAIGDALAVALMSWRGFAAEDFARSHPGGSLGKRLHLEVKDLMIPVSQVPTLPPSASMSDVIDASTRGKMGAVLICSGATHTLSGIITDGDIRRALSQQETFFRKRAEEIMTHSPITVSFQASAWDALRLMEDRPSQIGVLPVLDGPTVLGLIRLHDLVRTL